MNIPSAEIPEKHTLAVKTIKQRGTKMLIMDKPVVIAHRGESYDAPENTLAAVNLAWKRGISAVEIDVQQTSDGEICVIHDRNTLRTTGKNFRVSRSKLAELQALDAGLWKGKNWKGEKIPSLRDVLASVPEHGKLIIEIKSDKNLLEQLGSDIAQSKLRNKQIEIIAFNMKTLAKAKQIMPQHKMLWLFSSKPIWLQYLSGTHPGSAIRKLKKYNIDGVNVGDSKHFTKKFIEIFTSAGFPVYTYTVNNPGRALELLKYGVDCVTTDRAAWMQKQIKTW